MFARWSRFAFRRCLHTRPPPAAHQLPYNRLALALGLSAATATYITWHLSSDANRIALDSSHNAGKLSNAAKTSKSDPEPDLQPSSAVTEPQSTEEKDTGSEDGEGATTSGGGGAFNPETGEINWDCPCLGGMAHGPCGLQFREAFSCFVFSEAEPKGMECIEKFKAMQDCFREHPDVYADEIKDDDEAEGTSTTGEQSSTETAIAETTKGEVPTTPPPPPPPKPSPEDFSSNTPTSTASP